jgi:glycosyltransferase involved in cell wall biosynthesis
MPEKQLRVLVGADPLLQQATGIGTYTRNLLLHLQKQGLVDQLKLFANGVFLRDDTSLLLDDLESGPPPSLITKNRLGRARLIDASSSLRQFLTQNRLVMEVYDKILPLIERGRLRPFHDYVFHSPNYLLPKFDGPTVVTIHDLSIQRYPEFHPAERVKFLEAKIAAAAACATRIITDSTSVKAEIIDYFGIDKARITAIPLAASSHFRYRTEEECRSFLDPMGLTYKRFFLFASTIEPRKNLLRICAAYKNLRQAGYTDWPIIFVGGSGWRSEAEHIQIKDLVDRGWAQYLGFVEPRILPFLYSSAAALVFPSIYEGFGLPALEAQQSGTRVITSRNSAMAEFASGSDLLVDPLQEDSIMEGMARAVDSDADDDRLQRSGRASGFSWENTARLTAEVYAQASKT